jgi:hypothetical protein
LELRNDSDEEARHQFYNTLEIPRIRIKLFKAIWVAIAV